MNHVKPRGRHAPAFSFGHRRRFGRVGAVDADRRRGTRRCRDQRHAAAGRAPAALCAAGQARHLSAPDRLAAESGRLRLQAGAGQTRRPGLPATVPRGPHVRVHVRHAETDGHAAQVRPVRPVGRPGCPTRCPIFMPPDIADEMCFIHSMNTDQFNHAPAELLLYTGSPRSGRPALGSWVTYGLGTENENLPGFVVLISSGVQPNGGANSFGSGFLPSVFQGVQCRSKGDPVLYVSDPPGMDRDLRRRSLDALATTERVAGRRAGASRNADAHRPVRARVPHASVGARSDGHHQRNAGNARGLRRRARRKQLRQQLPARPATGRARRALRAAVRLGLGFPRHRPPTRA